MSDKIGSVRMDFEEEIVMPVSPVRANQSIPTVTAIILILGAVIVGYTAYTSFVLDEQFTEEQEEQLATQFTDSGDGQFNVSKDDMEEYDDNFSNSKYKTWSGTLLSSSALFLLTGGILLYKGDRRGIYLGLVGAVILTSTSLWASSASEEAAQHLPEVISITIVVMYYLYACCGVFCVMSAVMPMFFASGRAALSSPLVSFTPADQPWLAEIPDPDEEEE